MNRIIKSRKGFALAEMILVVAIIVILAAVLTMSVSTYINNARARSNEAAAGRRSVLVNIASSEEQMNNLGFGNTGTNVHVHNGVSSAVPSAVAGS
ncbi:MAG: prepilin-type N-terminal cleavage/methylation domain-containing protein [Clostridiales bacterium]|nr:prepilin-type N-terminal cleavage/methylation domain-containing protein [Clostridiales bacterium]